MRVKSVPKRIPPKVGPCVVWEGVVVAPDEYDGFQEFIFEQFHTTEDVKLLGTAVNKTSKHHDLVFAPVQRDVAAFHGPKRAEHGMKWLDECVEMYDSDAIQQLMKGV